MRRNSPSSGSMRSPSSSTWGGWYSPWPSEEAMAATPSPLCFVILFFGASNSRRVPVD